MFDTDHFIFKSLGKEILRRMCHLFVRAELNFRYMSDKYTQTFDQTPPVLLPENFLKDTPLKTFPESLSDAKNSFV